MSKFRVKKLWQIFSAATSYILFGLGALIVGVFFRLLNPVTIISPATKQKWIRWCIHKGCLTFIRFMRFVGLIRYSFDVESMLQAKPGHIVIANHPSLIDVVLLLAVNKNLCCFVKSAVWNNFFTGAVARQAGFVPNNAEEVLTITTEKLEAGENLLIFPEGTRTKIDGNIKFKRGAANMAVAVSASIMPIFIKCNPGVLRKGDKWYIIPDGGSNFSLTSGPLLKLDDHIDTTKSKPLQYRELTQFLEDYYTNWNVSEISSK
jgi:1-acyl-sn-glycerol-3-phosphate acyltransferase